MSGFGQFPRKQAHFEREEHPLLSCHRALNSNKVQLPPQALYP
jgi:hypothetical protein